MHSTAITGISNEYIAIAVVAASWWTVVAFLMVRLLRSSVKWPAVLCFLLLQGSLSYAGYIG